VQSATEFVVLSVLKDLTELIHCTVDYSFQEIHKKIDKKVYQKNHWDYEIQEYETIKES